MDRKTKHSLLIIDDESVNLKVLNQILAPDYTILTANNGHDGIEKAKEYLPDLILLDIIMPDMDGYQTFSALKKNNKTMNIPVIFISGIDSEEYEEKGSMLEAADYISKPFNALIIKLRVRNQFRLRNALKTAAAANRSKSVFLAKMSHGMRAPLNKIIELSTNYVNNVNYPKDINDAFLRIYNSGNLMLGVINDVLDMSMIEAGKLELSLSEYNIAGLINDIYLFNSIKYEKKPVEFLLKIDENIPSKFIGDEIRIKQILNNLLSNAFKYTSSGEVELSISADNTVFGDDMCMLVFRVRDTGQGMMEEQLSKLFDEYTAGYGGNYSPDAVYHSGGVNEAPEAGQNHEGAGLGMSILMELIKMMNGKILAKSEAGAGTLFTVRLPQKNAGAPALGKEAAENLLKIRTAYEYHPDKSAPDSAIPFGKVLVVDDVEINQFVIKEMLSYYGLEIDLASSGKEALDKIKSNDYNLVFMDYVMPGMDGLETAREIRKLAADSDLSDSDKYKNLPVVALTANAGKSAKEMFLDNGFNDYISKPVDMQDMSDILKKWMIQDM